MRACVRACVCVAFLFCFVCLLLFLFLSVAKMSGTTEATFLKFCRHAGYGFLYCGNDNQPISAAPSFYPVYFLSKVVFRP